MSSNQIKAEEAKCEQIYMVLKNTLAHLKCWILNLHCVVFASEGYCMSHMPDLYLDVHVSMTFKFLIIILSYIIKPLDVNQVVTGLDYLKNEICFLCVVVCLWLSWILLCGIWTVSLSCKSHSQTLIAAPAFRIPVWCIKWGPTSPWWRACDSAAVLTPEKWGSWASLWDSSSSSCQRSVTGWDSSVQHHDTQAAPLTCVPWSR